MKITIDVPDVLPANFESPSGELLGFISGLQELCCRLDAQYKDIEGRELFTAFIRNGSASVFSTTDHKTHPIYDPGNSSFFEEEDESEEYSDQSNEAVAFRSRCVVMERDVPRRWVVSRFCVTGWFRGNPLVLYSSDFESKASGRKPRAERLLRRIVLHLETIASTVPQQTGPGQ